MTAEITIIGLEIINKSIINKLPNLKTIIKYGVGLDKIDLNYLKKKILNLFIFLVSIKDLYLSLF